MNNNHRNDQIYKIIIDNKDKDVFNKELIETIEYKCTKIIENYGKPKIWERYKNIGFKIIFE